MARGYRNRSSYAPASYGHTNWPHVISRPVPPFRSILEPQTLSLRAVEPSDLAVILKRSAKPVLDDLAGRAKITLPPAPSLSGAIPNEPVAPAGPPPSAQKPLWDHYRPTEVKRPGVLGALQSLLNPFNQKTLVARREFEQAERAWEKNRHNLQRDEAAYTSAKARHDNEATRYRESRARLETELAAAQADYHVQRSRFEDLQQADEDRLADLIEHAKTGHREHVEALAVCIINAIPMPLPVPLPSEAQCDDEEDILLLTLTIPNVEEAGLTVSLKTKTRAASEREVRSAQEFLLHALPLRIMHEVFACRAMGSVKMVGVNMRLQFTDRRNGKRMDEIVGSVAATRSEFADIDISAVDPKLCFRSLKGVATPSYQEVSPVRPILTFNREDARIVEGRAVLDTLDRESNLAAMDWEDFEHTVRELFGKMFTKRSENTEVHVTRASRDYGVDALIHDPDPIHGGKFVIQAKRYVNTVDVAAVRDLFGTVQNEGANRGFLVTTSSFGPDAHAFAKGKPLTLIDGSHLLQLLSDYGYNFRIDLAEARRELHGR